MTMKIAHFSSQEEFRKWLVKNHAAASELFVGFHKKSSGKKGATYSEALDEALCFGWIDGVRRSIDADSYLIRFSPRRPTSTWSRVNIKRAQELINEGRMRPAGLKAFEARQENRSGIYAYEQRSPELEEKYARIFKRNKPAWKFFQSQPPGYRKTANWWVVSAKRE